MGIEKKFAIGVVFIPLVLGARRGVFFKFCTVVKQLFYNQEGKKPKVLLKKKKNFTNPSRSSSSLSLSHSVASTTPRYLSACDHSSASSTSQRLAGACCVFHWWYRATFLARECLEGRVWHISAGKEDHWYPGPKLAPGELTIPLNRGALSLSRSWDETELLSGFRMGSLGERKGKDALARPAEGHINEVCVIRSVGPAGWGPWPSGNPVNVWLVFWVPHSLSSQASTEPDTDLCLGTARGRPREERNWVSSGSLGRFWAYQREKTHRPPSCHPHGDTFEGKPAWGLC